MSLKDLRYRKLSNISGLDIGVDSSGYYNCQKCGKKTNNVQGSCSECLVRKCVYPECETTFRKSARANYSTCKNHRTKYILENVINGKFVGKIGLRRDTFISIVWLYIALTNSIGAQ